MDDAVRVEVAGTEGLFPLRQGLAGLLDSHSVDADTAYDVQLIVSELVTNGLMHGGADSVDVHASVLPDRIEMTVSHDKNRRTTPVVRPIGVGGRGLEIVRAIAKEFTVDHPGEQRRATAVVGRPAPHVVPAFDPTALSGAPNDPAVQVS